MKEKYFYIPFEKARDLLRQISEMQPNKRGLDSRVYLIDEFAVLTTTKLKLRNYTTRDDDLLYYDELIQSLMHLKKQGVAAVPILGYCYDPDSENGDGYIIQQRAKGEELYDDAALKEFYIGKNQYQYLPASENSNQYLFSRTNYISEAPQTHFDKWINDIIVLLDNDILVDFNAKSNFFYDANEGFSFIDLNSHTDYKYGLVDQKPNSREIVAYYGFLPCHFSADTKILPNLALNQSSLLEVSKTELSQLASANNIIFEKCKSALLHNGVSQEQINNALMMVKLFGV